MSPPRLYFAYGSNMNPEQMIARCPGARFLCRATLPDHALDFTRDSPARGCGVADVVLSPGDEVWGVIWQVSDTHIQSLDRLEGHGTGEDAYRRIQRQVRAADGDESNPWLTVETYEVARKVPFVRPDATYMALVLAGARHWRLPADWLGILASVRTRED